MLTSFGRYNLLLKLGEGGMGAVYLACQKTLRRYCAVKVIAPQFSKNTEAADRFLREARATAALSHANLVSIYDCDQFESQYFIAMEYVGGMTLGQVLRKRGALPLPLALFWLNQAAAGLEYVHAKGIVHRDIKPDNMIIDANGVLKIMDLGLAKAHFEADQSTTVTGTVMGSPHYMSPEQIDDSKSVDHRTDLYALGITFFQMLTGRVPFERSSTTAVCIAHLQELVPSVNLADTELTRSLDDLVLKMTAKKQEERFQSGSELVAALGPWVAAYPMDETSQQFFGQLGFEQYQVEHLLEKEGIDPARVAEDLGPAMKTSDMEFRTAAPMQPPPKPGRSWHHYVAWAAVALVLLLIAGGVVKGLSKGKPKPPPPVPSARKTSDQRLGGLVVETQPKGAVVSLGPRSLLSPATFNELAPGKLKIKVSLDGYADIEREVEVVANDTVVLKLTLERIKAWIHVASDPPGADVYLAGSLRGKTPCDVEGFSGQTQQGSLQLAGYNRARIDASFEEGKTNVVDVTLHAVKESNGAVAGTAGVPPVSNQKLTKLENAANQIEHVLDKVRETSDEEWASVKSHLVSATEEKLKTSRPNVATDKIDETMANYSGFLEKVRSMPAEEYNAQKQALVKEAMLILASAGRPGARPGNPPARRQKPWAR